MVYFPPYIAKRYFIVLFVVVIVVGFVVVVVVVRFFDRDMCHCSRIMCLRQRVFRAAVPGGRIFISEANREGPMLSHSTGCNSERRAVAWEMRDQ